MRIELHERVGRGRENEIHEREHEREKGRRKARTRNTRKRKGERKRTAEMSKQNTSVGRVVGGL
jgi:hypothetical protein